MKAEVIELHSQKKTCSKCGLEKYLDHFSREKQNKTDGRRGSCKKCDRESRQKYRDENRELLRSRDRQRYHSLQGEDRKEFIKRKVKSNKKQRDKNPSKQAIYNKSDRGLFSRYRLDATRRGRNYVFDLTFDEFSKLINSCCKYCGKENCRGVDRLDNSIGYIKENSVPCCGRCNEMKNSASLKEWLDEMEAILRNLGRID